MKSKILSLNKGSGKEVELPAYFSQTIREDIAYKAFEALKTQQPHGPNPMAGKLHSASGIIRHRRRKWKTAYGHGISRIPRKIFWRRGTQFYWVGAFIASTRGGRRPHAPKVEHFLNESKINKKEFLIALKSSIASTASKKFIEKRYSTVKHDQIGEITFPIVIDDSISSLNTRKFFDFLKENFGELKNILIKKKSVRAGRGKLRNRKYKSNAGLLLVLGKDEKKKITGIDVKNVQNLEIEDLMPLGRLTIYTEKAIKDLANIKEK